MTDIVDVVVEPFDLELEDPFEIALGTQTEASNVLVTVETESGVRGIGEGAPIPPVTGETQASAMAVAEEMSTLVTGCNVANYRALSERLASTFPHSSAARLAVETAIVDAYCRELDVPLAGIAGGTTGPVETDITIPVVSPDVAREQTANAADTGYGQFKVKTGTTVERDVERVAAVADAAPDAEIKVDANQGWTVGETLSFVRTIRERGIDLELVEQPVDREDVAGLAEITHRTAVPIAADESLFTPADAICLVRNDAADVLNLKLGKTGLVEALDIIAIARAANRELMIGCMLQSAVAIHTSAHLVAGTGAFSYVDLDGNRLLSEDVIDDEGPRIDPIGPGHGVSLE